MRSARRACGSTRGCGRISPTPSASGRIWSTPTSPIDNDFIESEWWALKQIWDKGLLYKGFKIVPYCPRCGTPLSSHEVAQGYKDVKERSAIAKFKVKGEDAYFLAWTTTPWTLPSNVALCVNPDERLCQGRHAAAETYILAEALADIRAGARNYTVLETYTGKELEWHRNMSRCSISSSREEALLVCHLRQLCHPDRRHRRGPYRPGLW